MHKPEMSGVPVIQEIETALSVLFKPGQVMEVRAITDDGVASGYFNDPAALANAVSPLDTLPGVQGIYVTLNAVNPALLSRRANRIKMRLSKKDATTADADIISRRWFPVDIDPVRPSGVSATEAEHHAAMVKADRIATYLADLGWPAPVVADSGNGAHLLYLIDLPNDEVSRELVKKCLEVLTVMFDDPESTIDTTVHNPARIWKLYGTMCRKGDNTSDRPHRRAMVESLPGEADAVSDTLLVRLAECLPVAPANPRGGTSSVRGHGRSPDLGEWLHEHDLLVSSEKPYQGGTLFALQQCPFSADHKDGAFAIQFGNGAIYAGCHHASCGRGVQRWPDLRETFEPKVAMKKVTPDPPPPLPLLPVPGLPDIPAIQEAMAVLEHGDPLRAMLNTFALDHVGDETVAACLVMSLASRSVINTVGLHVSVTGESGKGKSHAFSKMLLQVPQRFRLSGRMSNKALFYLENLVPGMVIVLDDTTLSEEMQEVLKGVTTSFNEPFEYRTVNKDRKPQVCTIPERCTWWVAKVEGSGDDQVFNRMLTCWIDDTADQDDRVLACILAKDSDFPVANEVERPELSVCRAMWEVLGRQRLYVRVPFSEHIEFQSRCNRRNSGMLLDLIKAHALLRFMQRESIHVGSISCITATLEDFYAAVRLFDLLNGSAGGQTTKLTKKESDLLDVIARNSWPEFTTSMLQKATGLSNGVVYRTMHGYVSRGYTYSGLLEKCPAIAYTDRTVVCDENDTGISMRRRTNAYTFDDVLFRFWCSGGSVWLRKDPSGNDGQTTEPGSRNTESFRGDEFHSTGRDSGIAGPPTHSCTSERVYSGKVGLAEPPGSVCELHTFTHCEVQDSAGQNEKSSNESLIGKNRVMEPGIPVLNVPPEVQGQDPIPPGEIRPGDYRKADYPDRVPCSCCGKRGDSWFIEKITRERVNNPALPARRLCRTCHGDALLKEQASGVPLPGVLPLGSMSKVSRDLGRCSVCDIGSAAWYDEATKVKLCDYCYNREIARQAGGSEQEGMCQ